MSSIGPGLVVNDLPVWAGSFFAPDDPTTGTGASLSADLSERNFRLLNALDNSLGVAVGAGWSTPAAAVSQPPDWTTNWLSIGKSIAASSGAAGAGVSWVGNAAVAHTFFSTVNSFSGGFLFYAKGGVHTANATSRSFIGCRNTVTVIGNVDPSTLTNVVFFGNDDTDANLQVMHNDGAGACTKVDLGANFPAQTSSADFYEYILYSAPGQAASIQYYIRHMFTGNSAAGDITTNMPAAGAPAFVHAWMNAGATASVVRYAHANLYIEGPASG